MALPGSGPGLGFGTAAPRLSDHALVQLLEGLQLATATSRSSSSSSKKSKKDKKDKKTKKKKKKDSDSSQSSASSPSSRAKKKKKKRSRSSSSERSRSPVRWKLKLSKKEIPMKKRAFLEQEKFKNKTALLTFAMQHPGALTAHFLNVVHRRLSRGVPQCYGDLQKVSVAQWAEKYADLTEVRDLREVQTLAECLDKLNRNEVEQCADVICQRIQAIRMAKRKGGSWEKAESLELITSGGAGNSTVPPGMLGLL